MKVFVTGTGTGVGKTVVSSWIAAHNGSAYFKPLQTGIEEDEPTDSEFVGQVIGKNKIKIYPEWVKLKAPLSPYHAALKENISIEIDHLVCPDDSSSLVVEGAGGLMVPIHKNFFMIDFIQRFDLPVVLVTSTALGMINHTLLSIEALKHRGIKFLGIVMNGPYHEDNFNYFHDMILGHIPYITEPITYDLLQKIPMHPSLKMRASPIS